MAVVEEEEDSEAPRLLPAVVVALLEALHARDVPRAVDLVARSPAEALSGRDAAG